MSSPQQKLGGVLLGAAAAVGCVIGCAVIVSAGIAKIWDFAPEWSLPIVVVSVFAFYVRHYGVATAQDLARVLSVLSQLAAVAQQKVTAFEKSVRKFFAPENGAEAPLNSAEAIPADLVVDRPAATLSRSFRYGVAAMMVMFVGILIAAVADQVGPKPKQDRIERIGKKFEERFQLGSDIGGASVTSCMLVMRLADCIVPNDGRQTH